MKREGDGATPAGYFPFRRVLFRTDRVVVRTRLPVTPIARQDGWCTDPDDRDYNQPITLPRHGRYENLWRDDHLYDIVVVIGYNDAPAVPGGGSAIFLHVARSELSPTDGCVAVAAAVLLEVLRRCDSNTFIEIKS